MGQARRHDMVGTQRSKLHSTIAFQAMQKLESEFEYQDGQKSENDFQYTVR
jgi:hypothetical protein